MCSFALKYTHMHSNIYKCTQMHTHAYQFMQILYNTPTNPTDTQAYKLANTQAQKHTHTHQTHKPLTHKPETNTSIEKPKQNYKSTGIQSRTITQLHKNTRRVNANKPKHTNTQSHTQTYEHEKTQNANP